MVYSASFKPPALPVTNSGPLPWIFLDKMGYISDCVNATKAEALMSTGQPISVSFFTAEPPAVSYFCVHCPGLMMDEYSVKELRIVCSEDNVVLLSICLDADYGSDEYFIYRAVRAPGQQQPSLKPLPDVGRYLSKLKYLPEASVAFVLSGGGEHFVLAALGLTLKPGQYKLHIFRSELGTWTDQLLVLGKSELGAHRIAISPVKVIMLGGGEIGWVDLCQGILVCNVLNDDPAPRMVPLPKLLPANLADTRKYPLQHLRDIICTDGLIKLVEMELCYRPILPKTTDVSEMEVLYDSESRLGFDDIAKITYEYLGWRAITWERMVSSNCWRRGCLVHADDILVNNPSHHVLLPNLVDKIARRDLLICLPTLSMDGSDVVYFMSKVEGDSRKAWVLAVDMRKKTVEKLLSSSTIRYRHSNLTYVQCTLSKYLNTDTDGTQIIEQNTSLLGSSTLQPSRLVGVLALAVAVDQVSHVKRLHDEEQRLEAPCWCENSSKEVFVCEHVCSSKRMHKNVGAFSYDPTLDTCVTVFGVSEPDACTRSLCQSAPGAQLELLP